MKKLTVEFHDIYDTWHLQEVPLLIIYVTLFFFEVHIL